MKISTWLFILGITMTATSFAQLPFDQNKNAKTGPEVGEPIPEFRMKDQAGRWRTLDDIRGPKGAYLVFHRSADWWPYCKTQLVELEQAKEKFAKEGLGVAAISYDSVELLEHFAKRLDITIPLLSDEGSEVIRAFGLFNQNIPTDNYRYGVPFPGAYLVDERGIVRAKFFEKILLERITAETVLTKQFGVEGGAQIRAENRDLALTAYSSQDVIRRGNRITLVLDIEMADKTHVYAPGAKGYKPVFFTIDENPHIEVQEAQFPEPHILDMPEIEERIPVFEDRFRISRDVIISHEYAETGSLEITGTLGYQACFETICYEPETIPLSFGLELIAHDDERVPDALRKKEDK